MFLLSPHKTGDQYLQIQELDEFLSSECLEQFLHSLIHIIHSEFRFPEESSYTGQIRYGVVTILLEFQEMLFVTLSGMNLKTQSFDKYEDWMGIKFFYIKRK